MCTLGRTRIWCSSNKSEYKLVSQQKLALKNVQEDGANYMMLKNGGSESNTHTKETTADGDGNVPME